MADEAAANLQGLQNILMTCGIGPVATHTQLINNEGLTFIADLGLLDVDNNVPDVDNNVLEMANIRQCKWKRMGM